MTNRPVSLLNKELCNSDHAAIICGDRKILYSQLFHAVGVCAKQLRAIGIKPDNRVALCSPNSIEYIIALLSLWSLKAIACPLNTRLPNEALENQLQQINAQYLLISQDSVINGDAIAVKKIDLLQIVSTQKLEKYSSSDDLIYDNDQNATILFTSGNSGKPKAVLHTLGNHITSAKGSNDLIPIVKDDRWLLSLPIYHVGGLSIMFRTLLFGGTIVLPSSDKDISKAVEAYALTHISLVSPQLLRLLENKNLHSKLQNFKAILVGGSSIPQSLLKKSTKLGCPIYTTYGSTECASQMATAKYPSPVKILNGRKIKISEEGEILADGKTLFSGYVDGNTIDLPLTSDGWFATGDLGFIDRQGGLIVTGRKDNMFISGGENIHPEEIERSLYQVDLIEQAVVIPIQNAEFGFRPIAFIKTHHDSPIKREELWCHLGSKLPKFKIPEKFYEWPADPSAANFKIDRRYLRRLIDEKNTLTEIIQ